MAAVGSVLPIASLQAMAQEGRKGGAIEKKDLKIGFIPITCATPLIMAHPLGFYSKQGLNVEVVKTAGWALIRDKMLNKEYDATHFLSPMPLAITLGLGSSATPMHARIGGFFGSAHSSHAAFISAFLLMSVMNTVAVRMRDLSEPASARAPS